MHKWGWGVLVVLIFLAIAIILAWQRPSTPPGIPTSDIDYWNEHKDEYNTTDGIHYTHPGGNVEYVGKGWKDGYYLTVQSDAGKNVGYNMQGGIITVQGNAGDYIGNSMQGGTIIIEGSAGSLIGSNMKDGTITIQGNAGMLIGKNMQAGSITIHGNVDTYIGSNMQGGTITIQGKTSNNIGEFMSGGTITINCEGVTEDEACTGNELGYAMYKGTIYIKGKAGPLATGNFAPQGGEIWEYWGTYKQKMIYQGIPPEIPTANTRYWHVQQGEYTKINSTHYIHPGNTSYIGTEWKGGYYLTVQGNAGDYVGSNMKGGIITVQGDAGLKVGIGMSGGNIIVQGNAGWRVGSEMSGGSITVQGNAGTEVGIEMQGGTIIVQGSVGNKIGTSMKGGNIIIQSKANRDVGDTMQGGTITINCEGIAEGERCTENSLGSGMFNGTIYIMGNTGDWVGDGMQGGTITIQGNAGWEVGSEMSGGTIIIQGNAGHRVGRGMTGGTIIVQGNGDNNVGEDMQGGTIIIKGNVGDYLGQYMQGGTITINCEGVTEDEACTGNELGYAMYNGTIYIKGKAGPLATGQSAPQGGEIWEYWGTPQEKRIYQGIAPQIPTSIIDYWISHEDEYTKINSTHYTHPGNDSNFIGRGWKQGYYLTIQGRAGIQVGDNMQGGTITINCEGVAEDEECTKDDIGWHMENGTIYIKGKAGSLARGTNIPQGGEIWEYWGTPQQRRIFPASS